MSRFAIGMLVLALLSACPRPGVSESSSSSSSSSGGSISGPYDFAVQQNNAVCEATERCVTTRGRSHTTLQACKDALGALDSLYMQLDGLTYEQELNQTVTLDATQARACLDGIAAAPCNTSQLPDACRDALVPIHSLPTGASCGGNNNSISAPVCANGSSCVSAPGSCPTCVADLPDGAMCNQSSNSARCEHECDGTHCVPSSNVAKAATCSSDSDCVGNLVCTGTGASTCQDRSGVGAPCGATSPACLGDLFCVAGTCRLNLTTGAACNASSTTGACPPFSYCLLPGKTIEDGTCGIPNADSADCVWIGYGGGNTQPYCGRGRWADVGTNFSCTCRPLIANGQACGDHVQCASLNCSGLTGTPPMGTCAAPAAVGQACGLNAGCASQVCDSETRECIAPTCG